MRASLATCVALAALVALLGRASALVDNQPQQVHLSYGGRSLSARSPAEDAIRLAD